VKKSIPVLIILWVLSAGVSSQLFGRVDGELSYLSSYIWRGFDLNPRHWPVVQPSVFFKFGDSGLALQMKGIFSFHDREVNEFNGVLSYSLTVRDAVRLTGGLIHYGWYFSEDFSFGYDTSHEIFISTAFPTVPLHPALTLYYDFHNGDGLYVELKAGHFFPLRKWLGIRASGTLGYNGGQWLTDRADSGLSDLDLMVEIPVKLGPVSLTPFIRYTSVLLEAIGKESFPRYGLTISLLKK